MEIPSKGFRLTGGYLLVIIFGIVFEQLRDWMEYFEFLSFVKNTTETGMLLNEELIRLKASTLFATTYFNIILGILCWVFLALWVNVSERDIQKNFPDIPNGWKVPWGAYVLFIPLFGQFLSLSILLSIWRQTEIKKHETGSSDKIKKSFPILIVTWWTLYIVHLLLNGLSSTIYNMVPGGYKLIIGKILFLTPNIAYVISYILLALIVMTVWSRMKKKLLYNPNLEKILN
jgi:Domain of unknown function (DUF4328)